MKLSVIIPVYNVEAYLRACLDSVLESGDGDWEIVAVNDGSTDGSGAILAEYAARFPGIMRVITTPNGGLGHARNTGLEAAQGEYVLFVDSDDLLLPHALTEMLALLDGSFDIAVFSFRTVDGEGRTLGETQGCGRSGDFTLTEYPQLLFERPNAWNKLWRRSLFTESGIRFPDRLWFEDLATSPRLYLRARLIRGLDRVWYAYREQRQGSIMSSARTQRNLEIIEALDLSLQAFRDAGVYERYAAELEYTALFHQILTACDRVALQDPKSPVLPELVRDFLGKFPNWRENPYVRGMGKKHRLLVDLSMAGRFGAVRALMTLNNRVRGRK